MIQSTRRNFLKIVAAQVVLSGFLVVALPLQHAGATAAATNLSTVPASVAASNTEIKPGSIPQVKANESSLKNVLLVVFGIIGAFALMNITFSGIKYITSGGNSQKTSEAKNGIIYALVGLLIAISAEAIVAFWVTGP